MKKFPDEAHSSSIELSQEAFENNIDYIRTRVAPDTELGVVMKGNAYGHGIEALTELAIAENITTFFVFSAYEAYRVKCSCQNKPVRVIIMGYIHEDSIAWAIEEDIELFVFDLQRLNRVIFEAKRLDKPAKIHLEVETGMNRTGFERDNLKEVGKAILSGGDTIQVKGLCTHFAGAEEVANYVRIHKQHKSLKWWRTQLSKLDIRVAQTHAVCSAGLLNYPEAQYDLVRVGIMMYGFWPSLETRILQLKEKADPLKRLLRWTSTIMSIKQVKLGDYIGYGSAFLATSHMTIATVPVGYAYGFSRSLSNNGRVLVSGKPAQVIGIVNMNLLIINISDLPEVKVKDEVVLIGRQGDQEISVASFSEMSQQLNYEMLTRLPADIPRIIKYKQEKTVTA